jgi:hypothetical protein
MKISGKFIAAAGFVLMLACPPLRAQGYWEFGVHYSSWSINLVKSLVVDALNDTVASDLKDEYMKKLRADFPSIRETGYTQDIVFDSSGNNYGAEVRYYPAGRYGSFSLGLSVEKTSMKVRFPEVTSRLNIEDERTHAVGTFRSSASGEFLIEPLSFHLSVRWDIFPTAGLHPYVTLGVGASTAKAIDTSVYAYDYTGTLTVPGGPSRTYAASESKTLKQLREEEEARGEDPSIPVNFVPFVQLSLGLKGRLSDNLYLLVDAGIWDGFILRAGAAFRF